MSELKAHRIVGMDERCARVDNDYYLKSEADRYINHLKYKRCMDNSFICFCLKRDANERALQACEKELMDIFQKWNSRTIRYEKWQFKWFELAKKFKEDK